jgi:hypothetical protein
VRRRRARLQCGVAACVNAAEAAPARLGAAALRAVAARGAAGGAPPPLAWDPGRGSSNGPDEGA